MTIEEALGMNLSEMNRPQIIEFVDLLETEVLGYMPEGDRHELMDKAISFISGIAEKMPVVLSDA